MNTTTKRKYTHSEAWLAKHAAKVEATAPHTTAKKAARKPKADKPMPEKKAAKPEKKAAKPEKKAAKKVNANCQKVADKLLKQMAKHVSFVKKATKDYGKILSEALKDDSNKVSEKIVKQFKRFGYEYDVENSLVKCVFTGKVKQPKVSKKMCKVAEPKCESEVEQPKENSVAIPVAMSDGASVDEDDVIANTDSVVTENDLANGNSLDDGNEDSENDSSEESSEENEDDFDEDDIDSRGFSLEDGQSEIMNDIWNSQRENGDFED